MKTEIAIVANGVIVDYPLIKSHIEKFPFLVAVDGGLAHIEKMGLLPDLIMGDFDSAASLLQKYSPAIIKATPDQNHTDLEKTLEFLFSNSAQNSCQKCAIFGALGGRTDHTLMNLYLLGRYPGKTYIETESELIFAIEKTAFVGCEIGHLLSLIPLHGEVSDITTAGLKWALCSGILSSKFMSISNETIQRQVTISLQGGTLLLIYQKNII